jgi:hypothetical protein
MDFSNTDWAVVAATFLGPIFAVLITLWLQDRSATNQTRMNTFQVMMRLRRHPTHMDFVGAFNLVPVHFHGVKKVVDAFREVQRVLNDKGWKVPEAAPQLNRDHEFALGKLLIEMSAVLGIKVDAADVQNGGYAPEGWQTEKEREDAMKGALWAVLVGASPLNIRVTELPEDASLVSDETNR